MNLTKEELLDLVNDNALLDEDIDKIIQALKLKELVENKIKILINNADYTKAPIVYDALERLLEESKK